MSQRLSSLTNINLDDLVGAFGWQNHPVLAAVARRVFGGVAQRFACEMLEFDANTGEHGLVEAARRTERLHVRDVRVFGADRLPSGRFLALSNHPGMTDTLALFAALNRPDLHVIALDRPFLLSLSNISEHLFYLSDQPGNRVLVVRQVARYLGNGGALLSFPAGHNEPDPDVYAGAVDSLKTWIDSAGVFVRLVPNTPVIPVCVRSVTWPRTAHHPLARLRRRRDDQQLLGSALQLLAHLTLRARPVSVRVQIGNPIVVGDRKVFDSAALHEAVLAEMKQLIETPMQGAGVSAL